MDDRCYYVETPEVVPISYTVAGAASRCLAATVDTLLILLLQIVLGVIALSLDTLNDVIARADTVVFAVWAIMAFVLLWGYYLLFELLWSGQTPGKRLIGLRVLREGGRPIDFSASAVRNLVRAVDFLPFAYGLGVVVMFADPRARRLGDLAEHGRYDVVLGEFAYMGQHLYRNPYLPAVHTVVSVHRSPMLEVVKALGLTRNPLKQLVLKWAARDLRRFETALYRSADRVLVLSAEERYRLLTQAHDLRLHVVPGGVDTDFFSPRNLAREQAIVTTGDYEDPANTDAVLWFAREVWPGLRRRHEGLVFYVVGPHPPETLLALQRRDPRIIISGWVADVRPYLARAKVFVCPQRLGSGVRGKLLEAMSMELPVVTTTMGGEGIPIQSGETGFVADTRELIGQYVDLLLGDVALRDRMGQCARHFVAERFSWERSGALLEQVLMDLRAR